MVGTFVSQKSPNLVWISLIRRQVCSSFHRVHMEDDNVRVVNIRVLITNITVSYRTFGIRISIPANNYNINVMSFDDVCYLLVTRKAFEVSILDFATIFPNQNFEFLTLWFIDNLRLFVQEHHPPQIRHPRFLHIAY